MATGLLIDIDAGVDHVRGPGSAHLILMYGDYECPYSRVAYRKIQRVERRLGGELRVAFRHFPLTAKHPHALSAAAAAEAASNQDSFWAMHELLLHRQNALRDDDLRRYATKLTLDVERFDRDRTGDEVQARIDRDIQSALDSGQVFGTPTLFIDGVLHSGGYEPDDLIRVLQA
jgi:protein-disulfide isomerase